MSSSLEELQSQLSEIKQLLSITPNDEGLTQLEKDLQELIQLTTQTNAAQNQPHEPDNIADATSSTATLVQPDDNEVNPSNSRPTNQQDNNDHVSEMKQDTAHNNNNNNNNNNLNSEVQQPSSNNDNNQQEEKEEEDPAKNKKKKKKKLKTTFEVPTHLVPNDTDTPAEASRKKRTVKALKNKWREQKKAEESRVKQQSWKDFQQKKKLTNTTSMFSSSTNGKVGVVQATTSNTQKSNTVSSSTAASSSSSSSTSRKRLWQDA